MHRTTMLLATAFLVGCGDPVVPLERPPDADPFNPPAEYADIYAKMEACSGLTGDFSRVRWYLVGGEGQQSWTSTAPGGGQSVGEWWPDHDIYLARGPVSDYSRTNFPGLEHDLAAHEILHDLLQDREHPSPPFGSCAPGSISLELYQVH